MKTFRPYLGWLLAAGCLLAAVPAVPAPPVERADADPVGEALVKLGYTRTKLYRDRDEFLYCDITLKDEAQRFYLDTGSGTTIVGDKFAKRVGITHAKQTDVREGWGGEVKTHSARFDPALKSTPITLPSRLDVAVGFGEKFLPHLGEEKAVGILGMDALNHHSAVIDAARGVMYTIDPWEREKGLLGEWTGTAAMTGGVDAPAEYVAGVSLRFDGRRAIYTAGTPSKETVFDVQFVRTHGDRRAFDWFAPDRTAPWRLIYKLDGDNLTVCLPYNFTDRAKTLRPTEFTSTKENDFALLTFKRAKGTPKK